VTATTVTSSATYNDHAMSSDGFYRCDEANMACLLGWWRQSVKKLHKKVSQRCILKQKQNF